MWPVSPCLHRLHVQETKCDGGVGPALPSSTAALLTGEIFKEPTLPDVMQMLNTINFTFVGLMKDFCDVKEAFSSLREEVEELNDAVETCLEKIHYSKKKKI